MKKNIFILFAVFLWGCENSSNSPSYLTTFKDVYIGLFDKSGRQAGIDYVLIYKKGETTGSRPTFWIPGNEIIRRRGYLHFKLPLGEYEFKIGFNGNNEMEFQNPFKITEQTPFLEIEEKVDELASLGGSFFDKEKSYWVSGGSDPIVNIFAEFLDENHQIKSGFKNVFAYGYMIDPKGQKVFKEIRMHGDEEGINYDCLLHIPADYRLTDVRFRAGFKIRPIVRGEADAENDATYPWRGEAVFKRIVPENLQAGVDVEWNMSKIPPSRLVSIRDSFDERKNWAESYDFAHDDDRRQRIIDDFTSENDRQKSQSIPFKN